MCKSTKYRAGITYLTLAVITTAAFGEPWWAKKVPPQSPPQNKMRPWWEENTPQSAPPHSQLPPPPPTPSPQLESPPYFNSPDTPKNTHPLENIPPNVLERTPFLWRNPNNNSNDVRGMFFFEASPEMMDRWMDRMDYWGNRMEQWANRGSAQGNWNKGWNQLPYQNNLGNFYDPWSDPGLMPW